MSKDTKKSVQDEGMSPVIGVTLMVAITVILGAVIGLVALDFDNFSQEEDSDTASFRLDKSSGTITPISSSNTSKYDIIVDSNKTKTVSPNVGESIKVNNASNGSKISIVNSETEEVKRTWEVDENTTFGEKDETESNPNLIESYPDIVDADPTTGKYADGLEIINSDFTDSPSKPFYYEGTFEITGIPSGGAPADVYFGESNPLSGNDGWLLLIAKNPDGSWGAGRTSATDVSLGTSAGDKVKFTVLAKSDGTWDFTLESKSNPDINATATVSSHDAWQTNPNVLPKYQGKITYFFGNSNPGNTHIVSVTNQKLVSGKP